MRSPETIIAGSRNILLALLSGVFSAASLALMVGLSLDPTVSSTYTLPIVVLGCLFTLTGLLFTRTYLRPTNGLVYDADQDRIGLSITSPQDLWWINRPEMKHLLLRGLTDGEESVQRWVLSLQLQNGIELFLAESEQRALCEQVAEAMKAKLKLPLQQTSEFGLSGGLGDGTLDLSVRRHAAMTPLLFSAGLCLMVMALFGFMGVHESPVTGFILSPLLLVLGLVVTGIGLVKRLARETLTSQNGRITHTFELGSKTLFERSFFHTDVRVSVLNQGLRGTLFELRSPSTVLVLAAGSSMRSTPSTATLANTLASLLPPT